MKIRLFQILPLCFMFWLLVISNISFAQADRQVFGKNRIQYRQFNWSFYSTPNFEIYYYDQGARLAKNMAEYLEEEYQRITDIIGYAPYTKTKIFLYSSNIDLLQSNVGLKDRKYDIGGQTVFTKTHIEAAFSGQITELKKELSFKVAKLYIDDMMYGGLISEVFQGNVFFSLPNWFVIGAAAYIAYGWNEDMDNEIRDMLKYKQLRKVKNFSGADAQIAGQSIWNYIAERHGKVNISNILNYTRIIRNEEKSFMSTLGIKYDYVIQDWINYYLDMAEQIDESFISPNDLPLLAEYKKNTISNHNKLSPDGKYLLSTTLVNGKYNVYIKNLETQQTKKIFSDGKKLINQEIDNNIPIVDWGDSTTVGILSSKNGIYILNLYDTKTGDIEVRDLRRFNQVTHMDIYPNGKLAVMSVDLAGQNDLYLISTISPTIRRLTNDAADNITPHFIPGTKKIVFASNRPTDSLQVNFTHKDLSPNYNLFVYDIDNSRYTVEKLTNDFGKNYYPVIRDEKYIYYLSDLSGISNIYRYNLDTKTSNQITKFSIGIDHFDISYDGKNAIYSILNKGTQSIYLEEQFHHKEPIFTQPTVRMQYQLAKGYFRNKEPKKNNAQEDISNLNIGNATQPKSGGNDEGILDVDSYNFEEEVQQKDDAKLSLLESIRKLRTKNEIYGPLNYEPRFVADNVITSWVIDPLIGFAPLIEYQMNDLLENHKFTGGAMVGTDFNSSRIFANYYYLGDRIDYKLSYERRTNTFYFINNNMQQFSKNELKLSFAFPFNSSLRAEVNPLFTNTTFKDADYRLVTQDIEPQKPARSSSQFIGGETGFIFDNSSSLGYGRIEGTQAKLIYRNFTNISGDGLSFNNLYLDVRNYIPIFKHITFASRLFYGNFFGQQSPSYMVGAIDNWLAFRQRIANQNTPNSPLRVEPAYSSSYTSPNLMFHEFVTNLRGFAFNELNGSQAAIFNAELRIPLVNDDNSSVNSNFIRNFKIIGFFDIGTAWSGGRTPWDRENSINTEIIKQGPYEAVVRNFKNPWLYSYGFGARTALFGYYVKVDWAYPVEDNIVGSPRLFISLGQDF